MNATKGGVAAIAIALLATACSGGDDPDTAPIAPVTTQATPVQEEGSAIRFDGASCELGGSTSLDAGLNEFEFSNTSGEAAWAILVRQHPDFSPLEIAGWVTQWWVQDPPELLEQVYETQLPQGEGGKSVSIALSEGELVVVCLSSLTNQLPEAHVAEQLLYIEA